MRWYHSFLTNRSQLVKVNQTYSLPSITNVGAPQGGVSSSLLFTLCTNDCRPVNGSNCIIKIADDTALLSLLFAKTVINLHVSEINQFVQWCESNHLSLNTSKTKDMIFYSKAVCRHQPVYINGQIIEQVSTYKYLGITLDVKLTWGLHVDATCVKAHQCLHFLHHLKVFGVDSQILRLFYQAAIESIL